MKLRTPRRDFKGLCSLEPSHPDMQGVEKMLLNGGERYPCSSQSYMHFGDLSPPLTEATLQKRKSSEQSCFPE